MTTLIDDSDVCALLIIFYSGETEEITYVRAPARLLTTSRSSTSAGANWGRLPWRLQVWTSLMVDLYLVYCINLIWLSFLCKDYINMIKWSWHFLLLGPGIAYLLKIKTMLNAFTIMPLPPALTEATRKTSLSHRTGPRLDNHCLPRRRFRLVVICRWHCVVDNVVIITLRGSKWDDYDTNSNGNG